MPHEKPAGFSERPAVLIGGLDKQWPRLLLSNLRYHVEYEAGTQTVGIVDAQVPTQRSWRIALNTPYASSYTEYAVIQRFYSDTTGNWMLSVNGLGVHSTNAAAELATGEQLDIAIPSSMRNVSNIQFVVRVPVVNGTTRNGAVVAVTTWQRLRCVSQLEL